jgi:transcriptional regulator with XRE-family HTH domain
LKSTLHHPLYLKIIQKLRYYRQDKGLSQSELANELGLKQPEVSKIEKMERKIDLVEFFEWLRVTKPEISKELKSLFNGRS